MRLWSIHPKYLDAKGLVALWREGLLAQNVLLGKTKGYRNHPQLIRFKNTDNQIAAIASYLRVVAQEADRRNYQFNHTKIIDLVFKDKIPVTNGQVQYEFKHLLNKLKNRDRALYDKFENMTEIDRHPLFYGVSGDVEDWEIM
ncbi:MAG: pyrimidine dimer DNA glycosylase/endonuclease V [Nitrosomonas sp.]|nr:pyrimidine dimer DNA glycosylase/endonuclease V [Nitrosomonas sp.]